MTRKETRTANRRGSTATGEEIGYDVGNHGAMKRSTERTYGPDRKRQPVEDHGNLLYVVPGVFAAPGLLQVWLRCERHAPPNGRPTQHALGNCVGCLAERYLATLPDSPAADTAERDNG